MQFALFNPQDPENRFWTVTSITRHIKDWLESDTWLSDCTIQGEISNLSRPSSGHMYFTLKDSGAQLKCVMWRTAASRLRGSIRDGDQVQVHGQITVYEASGQYQLIADSIQLSGEGVLYQEFIRLKNRLEAEGLFDPSRKRAIPEQPSVIGIVTSSTGAAIQDMLHTISRRYPIVHVVLAPAQVQGEDAPKSIISAMKALLDQIPRPQVVILARGGGSIEDLWCFNDEQVVRTIVNYPVPVVTGVGHETDFTLADFAADLRATTPTAAAELVTPDQMELRAYTLGLRENLQALVNTKIVGERQQIQHSLLRLSHCSPAGIINSGRQYCDNLIHRVEIAQKHYVLIRRSTLSSWVSRLNAVNPYAVLDRGYSIVQLAASGDVVKSVHQVNPDDALQIQTGDGSYSAVVSNST